LVLVTISGRIVRTETPNSSSACQYLKKSALLGYLSIQAKVTKMIASAASDYHRPYYIRLKRKTRCYMLLKFKSINMAWF
jgi:hypothetical protein